MLRQIRRLRELTVRIVQIRCRTWYLIVRLVTKKRKMLSRAREAEPGELEGEKRHHGIARKNRAIP
jgi:hypothetical protein